MPAFAFEHAVPLRWPPAWHDTAQLQVLRNTPINCILDAPASIAEAARATGLGAYGKDQADQSVHFLTDPVWPSIRSAKQADGAAAGPTGAPWVDANGWSIHLAHALDPAKPIWVEAVPEKDALQDDSAYQLAIADSAANGARWVVSLDEDTALGLAANDTRMAARWRKVISAIDFFQTHRSWSDMPARTNLAVLSDFSGDNEFMAKEFLNLATRRYLACLPIPKTNSASLTVAPPSVIYLDEQPPPPECKRALERRVQQGGLLIASLKSRVSQWGGTPAPNPIPGYDVRTIGTGRTIVPKTAWQDPYLVAQEVRILLGRRNDVLRLYNTGSMDAYYARTTDGNTGVVHLVNYTRHPPYLQVSVAPADDYSRASVRSLERPAGDLAKINPRPGSFNEIGVPPFSVYSAIELHR